MTKSVTTIEQSKHLLKLGFNKATADMRYDGTGDRVGYGRHLVASAPYKDDNIPAWSLAVLLDEIPKTVITDDGDEYTLQMGKDDDLTYVFGYYCEYTTTNVVEFVSQEAVEAAYELICWLLENKYI